MRTDKEMCEHDLKKAVDYLKKADLHLTALAKRLKKRPNMAHNWVAEQATKIGSMNASIRVLSEDLFDKDIDPTQPTDSEETWRKKRKNR